MPGEAGNESPTVLIDTLMRWYDTSSERDKAKLWTLILDFFMLDTSHGMPSRDWSCCSDKPKPTQILKRNNI